MAWEGDSRRHSLARKGIKTNVDGRRRFDVSNFVARGEGQIIHEQDYEGLDGSYHIRVLLDGRYELFTPSGTDMGGKFNKDGFSYRAKFQEPDIETWINSIGIDLINKGYDFKGDT